MRGTSPLGPLFARAREITRRLLPTADILDRVSDLASLALRLNDDAPQDPLWRIVLSWLTADLRRERRLRGLRTQVPAYAFSVCV